MTNVAPQGSYFNEHPWAMMERNVRTFSINNNVDLYVITGVIQAKPAKMVSGDAVPEYYYKAVCDPKAGKSFVSIGENDSECKECGVSELQPVSKVQTMLGYTLFASSTCGTSKVDTEYWDFSKKDTVVV